MRTTIKPFLAKPPRVDTGTFQVRVDTFARLNTPWHFHEEYELTLIDYTAGQRIVGSSLDTFSQFDLVLLGPNLPHAWKCLDAPGNVAPGQSVVVHFGVDCFGATFFALPELTPIAQLLQESQQGVTLAGDAGRAVADLLRTMPAADATQRFITLLTVLRQMALAPGRRGLSLAEYQAQPSATDTGRMNVVHAYLLHHFREEIALNNVAELANLSPTAFCRYFKLRTNRTLKAFVNELRVNAACQLLAQSRQSIAQISAEVGYANLSNFNRRFKELKQMTPQQYRQRQGGHHVA